MLMLVGRRVKDAFCMHLTVAVERLWPAIVKLTVKLKAINVLELYAGVTLGLLPDKEP